jgi:hypothetical protein
VLLERGCSHSSHRRFTRGIACCQLCCLYYRQYTFPDGLDGRGTPASAADVGGSERCDSLDGRGTGASAADMGGSERCDPMGTMSCNFHRMSTPIPCLDRRSYLNSVMGVAIEHYAPGHAENMILVSSAPVYSTLCIRYRVTLEHCHSLPAALLLVFWNALHPEPPVPLLVRALGIPIVTPSSPPPPRRVFSCCNRQ